MINALEKLLSERCFFIELRSLLLLTGDESNASVTIGMLRARENFYNSINPSTEEIMKMNPATAINKFTTFN